MAAAGTLNIAAIRTVLEITVLSFRRNVSSGHAFFKFFVEQEFVRDRRQERGAKKILEDGRRGGNVIHRGAR